MVTQIFTFGYTQTCPYTGEPLDDKYATVTAPTAAACRAVMVAVFGRNWCDQYPSVEAATAPGVRITEYARMTVELDGKDLVFTAGGVGDGA